jgi:transcriptional regulator with XRE-family HTH domain
VDIKLKIGRRIKELREQKKMAQKDLAYAADLDRSYIASIENGQRNVSIVNIEKIASALGVSLKEFFNDGELFHNHENHKKQKSRE